MAGGAINSQLTFAAATEVISAAAQTEVLALVDVLLDSIPDPTTTAPGNNAHTEWDDMSPRMASQLRVELAALKTAIDAAPTS